MRTDRISGQQFSGTMEGFCWSEACVVRQVSIVVKNPDQETVAPWKCPQCGRRLEIQAVRDMRDP